MASRDRALNFAVRVKGQQEGVAAFRALGQAATQSIDAIAAASAAAGAHDEAVARATNSAAAFGAAQAEATRKMAEAKAAFAAGTSDAEQYQRAVADAKSGLSVFKAENQAAARAVDATARTLVAAQQAAADYGRKLAAAKAAGSVPAAPGAVVPDLRSGAQRVMAGDASVDRAAVSATTLEQVLGRVAGKSRDVAAAMELAAKSEDDHAAATDRLRARYNPLYAVISTYLATVREIRQAEASGAISTDERTAAIQRERQMTLGAIAAIKAQTAAERGLSGAQRAGFTNLGFQINDVTTQLSAGTPVAQVFAQQSGQVIGALSMMGKEGGKMAAVLGGPWGLAITLGVSLLGLFATKLFETGHSVDALVEKLKKDAEETRKADAARAIFKTTTDGLIESQKALNKELDQSIKSQRDLTRATLQSAQANLTQSQQKRGTLVDQVAKAEQEVADARAAVKASVGLPGDAGGAAGAFAHGELDKALAKLKDLQAELARLDSSISESTLAVGKAQAGLARLNVDAELDPKAAAQKKYDVALNKLNIRLTVEPGKTRVIPNLEADGKTWKNETITSISSEEYAKEYRRIKAQLEADMKAAEAAARVSNSETGRELTPDEAAKIARGAGLQVNSVSRTYGQQKQLYDAWVANGRPADNPVAPPGTSAHEGAKGRWALDIQFGAGVTPELLRKVFAAQGVNLTKVFKERGHFHVEGSRAQADSDDHTEDKEAEERIRRQKAYEDQLAQVEGHILAAKRANVTDADQIAAFDKERIAVEEARAEADIVAKVQLGDYTVLQGKVLIEKQRQLAAERGVSIDAETMARHLADAADLALMQSQDQADLLNIQQGLAQTVAERRDLALALLAEDEKQARIKAQETLDLYALGKATKEQAEQARAALSHLDQTHPLKVETSNRQNQGALGKYLQDTDPKTINDRVETLVTNELTQVRDGIDDALTNALGVKDPMLKGLLEIFLDEVLFRPIAEALQKSRGGGGGGFGSILGAIGSLFGGSVGGGGGGALAGNLGADWGDVGGSIFTPSSADSLLSSLPGFASGTDDLPRGLSWVGENGRELLFNGGGGRISVLNHQQSRQMEPAFAGGGGGGLTVVNHFNSPQPGNPRRIGAVVGRSAQLGAARAARKGLAAPRGR